MSAWCVVNTLPHQELRAEHNLLRQGFRAWLPAIRQSRRHARRFDTVRAPLFPGYLFVELDIGCESWGRINNSYGVRRLLTRESRPEALPDDFVRGLRKTVTDDGTCVLAPTTEDLRPGARARIVSGPFTERIAVISGLAPGDRVKLLLDVLGGNVSTIMSRFAVVLEG